MYYCKGKVRGSCGVNHRSIKAAIRCRQKDQRYCRSVGGYSDRFVRDDDGFVYYLDYDGWIMVDGLPVERL